MKLRSLLAVSAVLATTLVATPAQAAPVGQAFTVTPADPHGTQLEWRVPMTVAAGDRETT